MTFFKNMNEIKRAKRRKVHEEEIESSVGIIRTFLTFTLWFRKNDDDANWKINSWYSSYRSSSG